VTDGAAPGTEVLSSRRPGLLFELPVHRKYIESSKKKNMGTLSSKEEKPKLCEAVLDLISGRSVTVLNSCSTCTLS
jgi:hypothetical protein